MRFFAVLGLVFLAAFASASSQEFPALQGAIQLLQRPSAWPAPNGHADWVSAINAAKTSIDLSMYRITDEAVANALAQAGRRGVAVRVIWDAKSAKNPKADAALATMSAGGVQVRGSSPGFSLMHMKAMVVDNHLALVTAINLSHNTENMRDFGLAMEDKSVVAEMESVFAADWQNAQDGGSVTPNLTQPNLVWSPINSEKKILDLINSATRSIELTVENLTEQNVTAAVAAAGARGVQVRVILPRCSLANDPTLNYPSSYQMAASRVAVHVMPVPSTATQPYMHSKLIIVDDYQIYIGSINFSVNSIAKAREVGIIFPNPATAAQILKVFEQDWSVSEPLPMTAPTDCPRPFGN